ncbi:reverse transcriptase domain-containing protein [Tanacetum coccineum]
MEDHSRGIEESYGDIYSQGTTNKSESSTSNGGHWKSRTKRRKLADEDDLAKPSTCEDADPFTPRIRNFKSSRKTRMPNNVKTYDGTGDPEDHLKIFQAAAQVEHWAMPTWCHMFNSLEVWFDELPPESIDRYKGLKAAFLAYFMQQKKYVKDLVEIHNIKQRDGETIEDFIERFKVETGRIKGAPECMRISGFMHGDKPLLLLKRKVTYSGNHKTILSGRPMSENLTFEVHQGKDGGLVEAKQAFKQLKQHLSELPVLVAPKPKEELIVYLSASYGAVSGVLMTERGHEIYFISRALQVPELNYTPMEKLVLSLVFAAKRAVTKIECHARRTQHHIPPRTSVKGQILADFLFTASNNEAEYEALIAGLRIVAPMVVQDVQVNVDSKLVANQVLGTYVSKEENMIKYLEKVKGLVSGFANFSISQVPRSKNKKADALSKIASTSFIHLSKQVLVDVLQEKSIQEKEVTTMVEEVGPTWMTPIMEYLKDGTLPGDRNEASKLRIKARQYELMEGTLYRRSFLKSYMHAGPRSVVAKAMRLGYYWPTMHQDARDMICACNDCQVHRPVPKNPQQPLTPITAPWPFYKWGIDIAGPFPEGPGKVKFLLVAMDYFTKWIEAKVMAMIIGNQVKKFVWDNR